VPDPLPLALKSPGATVATGTVTTAEERVEPLRLDVTWTVAVLPVMLNGTWKVTSLAESKILGTAAPFTSTEVPTHIFGTGLVLEQLWVAKVSPRFEPVMATTMPGAIGPDTIEASFNTVAAVKVGVCACAERANREKEIVIPNNDLRNLYSISKI